MSGFVKLDAKLLDSSTWMDKEGRDVFITCLLLAIPREYKRPMPQLDVDTGKPTGWMVPPGWYGAVDASPIAIAPRALLSQEVTMSALRRFGLPEAESRSQDWDGRRVVRIDGGFLVLNYMRHRDKDYTAAKRSKAWRKRQKEKHAGNWQPPPGARVAFDRRADARGARALAGELEAGERASAPSPPLTTADEEDFQPDTEGADAGG